MIKEIWDADVYVRNPAYEVRCDVCRAMVRIPRTSFMHAMNRLRRWEWRVLSKDGLRWEHVCAECVADEIIKGIAR